MRRSDTSSDLATLGHLPLKGKVIVIGVTVVKALRLLT